MRCIYCLQAKGPESFSEPEHVLPQSFGRFENNLTLWNTVCDECNQFFGDNLELELGRDTLEGEARFHHGVKPQSEYKSVGKRSRIIRQVANGLFKGAYFYLEYSNKVDQVVAVPCPQIGFLNPDSCYEYFLIDAIPTTESHAARGFDLKHPEAIKLLGVDAETAQGVLKEKGFSFKFGGWESCGKENETASLLGEVESTVDEVIFRAIAKIGFNYLAYWEGADFVRQQGFDAARNFIRWGRKPHYQVMAWRNESILADEPVEGKRRLGHLITVDWAADGKSILCQVSLNNWMTYAIALARDFAGEKRSITRGHFFNLASRRIEELCTGPRVTSSEALDSL